MSSKAGLLTGSATVVVVAAAIVAAAAGFGHRYGLWDYRTGFTILRWAVYVAAGAGVVALIGLLSAVVQHASQAALVGVVGVVIALAVLWPAWSMQRTGAQVPRIHDITTDTEHPPAFVAIVPLRKDAPNRAEYDGPKVAAEQKAAYSDIAPVQLPLPPAQAFDRALGVVRNMGWQIVATEPAEGRIEATDQTFWFGFKDDVVIRVAAADNGSRIDVRSKSRVGRNDFGTNAKRVRAYTHKLAASQ
jgi:uncharacterized protein (DUF1499 family)